jgi:hypothetical protein
MADLFDRLFVDKDIAVHSFHAATVDYIAGETTRNQIIVFWSMDSEAQTDLNNFLDSVDGISGTTNKLAFATELDAVNEDGRTGRKIYHKIGI